MEGPPAGGQPMAGHAFDLTARGARAFAAPAMTPPAIRA